MHIAQGLGGRRNYPQAFPRYLHFLGMWPFIYYVSTCRGEGGPKSQKCDNVIYEWSLIFLYLIFLNIYFMKLIFNHDLARATSKDLICCPCLSFSQKLHQFMSFHNFVSVCNLRFQKNSKRNPKKVSNFPKKS